MTIKEQIDEIHQELNALVFMGEKVQAKMDRCTEVEESKKLLNEMQMYHARAIELRYQLRKIT